MTRTLEATADDGTKICADEYGPQSTPVPVVCLPGLTRNARDFAVLARALSRDDHFGPAMRVLTFDLRGRGRSGWAEPDTYNPLRELSDVLGALDAWEVPKAHFVGTSRGGLITMLMAMGHKARIARVVLNDIGPRIEPSGLRRIAKSVGGTMEFPSFDDLAKTLQTRLHEQFPLMDPPMWMRFARQVACETQGGGARLDYDGRLADAFNASEPMAEPPDFWPAFDALEGCPVMVVRGERSDLLSAATVEAMRRRHKDLATHVVSGEGHAPLLWDRRTIEAIKTFLESKD